MILLMQSNMDVADTLALAAFSDSTASGSAVRQVSVTS